MKPTLPSLRRVVAMTVLAAGAAGAPARLLAQTPAPTPTPTLAPPDDPARAARLAWFKQAKYGMFIHFGLYALPAGEWKGKTIPGIGEWIMNRAKIPVAEYELLAKQFNPSKFNADEWVQLAQDAGMKYMVITSKHHDGFALFDSKVSTWDIADATPFKRDLLKELAAACLRKGMPLGFYYSQAQDWHEKGGAGNDWDFGPDQGPDGKELKDYDGYLRGKAEPQVRELLTSYGPVALIWFDTPRMMSKERGQRFVDIVRQLQPKTLIDGRLGVAGDYVSTGDNVIPGTAPADAWEVPATINHTWVRTRPGLEVARRHHVQARRHREHGNHCSTWGHASAFLPPAGLAARGGKVAQGERRRDHMGPSPWGDEAASQREGNSYLPDSPLPVAQRMARHHQAGQGSVTFFTSACRSRCRP